MRIGNTHADVYDRESDYWRDIEDVQNAQLEAQKNSQSMAVESEREKFKNDTGIVPQEDVK